MQAADENLGPSGTTLTQLTHTVPGRRTRRRTARRRGTPVFNKIWPVVLTWNKLVELGLDSRPGRGFRRIPAPPRISKFEEKSLSLRLRRLMTG